MDSSLENAALMETLEEVGKEGLLKLLANASAESDAELIKHLAKERERKRREKHSRRPK